MKICKLSKLKHVLLLTLVIGFSLQSFSQEDTQKSEFWKHVRFGGAVGLNFGDRFFSATLAPSAIYDFNNQFSLGVGLNGTYNKQRDVFKSTILGASIISLYNPVNQLQVSGEFEYLNVNQKFDNNALQDRNYWVPALYMGLGYSTNNITLGIRYDVLYDRDKSINLDPWAPFIRVFF